MGKDVKPVKLNNLNLFHIRKPVIILLIVSSSFFANKLFKEWDREKALPIYVKTIKSFYFSIRIKKNMWVSEKNHGSKYLDAENGT